MVEKAQEGLSWQPECVETIHIIKDQEAWGETGTGHQVITFKRLFHDSCPQPGLYLLSNSWVPKVM